MNTTDGSCRTSCQWLDKELQTKNELLHELQVHQIEMEMQNEQLRESQQLLEETRDRYADLYDFAPVGYMTLDESGVVQEINLTGAALLGIERMHVVDKPFSSFLSPASITSFINCLRQTFEKPGKRDTEIQIRGKDGKTRLLGMISLAVGDEHRKCRIVMNDITEQRRTAVDLQISRAAQDALLSAIPALVYFMDANLRFLNVSQAFADFVGQPLEEVVGKSLFDLFSIEAAEEMRHVAHSVLTSGMTLFGYEFSLTDGRGNLVHLSTVLAPFRDSQGNIIGLVGVSIDITMIKNVLSSNSELLEQNRLLARKNFIAQEEERRYLARELHDELGQWFTAIRTETQIISNNGKHDPAVCESADVISKSASAAHEVIRNMLRQLRPSMLDELGLADSLRELQHQWSASHPELVFEFKLESALEGLGDELNITIYRLVQEALNNVSRHANAQRVMLTVQREPAKNEGTEYIVLIIVDDGAGFDAKEVYEGTGLLGMRERVIAVGGLFFLESTAGEGTKIEAKLPILSEAEISKKRRRIYDR